MTARYVVDTSVVVQNLITDTYTAQAEALFAQVGRLIELWVPEFCLLECTNVLWKAVRFRGLLQTQAARLVIDLAAFPLKVTPASDLLPRALQIGLVHELPIYDSIYIAMAERLGCSLITVDQRQAQAATAGGVTIKPITDFSPSVP